ncbi:24439_t:CDS:2, partial [Cetraspora pellucida]
ILLVNLNEEEGDKMLDDDNIELMKKLHENIKALQFQNIIDFKEYIDHPEEKKIYKVLSNQKIVNLVTNPEPEKDKSQNMKKLCQTCKKQLENCEEHLSNK